MTPPLGHCTAIAILIATDALSSLLHPCTTHAEIDVRVSAFSDITAQSDNPGADHFQNEKAKIRKLRPRTTQPARLSQPDDQFGWNGTHCCIFISATCCLEENQYQATPHVKYGATIEHASQITSRLCTEPPGANDGSGTRQKRKHKAKKRATTT